MIITGSAIKRYALMICILALAAGQLSAQKGNKKITISGTVYNAAGKPIPNAIVMIDGVKTNSLTDAEGKYSVRVKPYASKIGIFTFGDGIREEDIAGRIVINFNFSSMSFQQPAIDEVPEGEQAVNTGYGYTRKKDLTTQMNAINGKKRKYASYSSVYEMIQRECSGVRVDGGKIIIQESRNIISGSIPALLIVDGVYVDNIGNIPPASVESITVLKGTSAAIYGSRGYGGAVVIKTKTGPVK